MLRVRSLFAGLFVRLANVSPLAWVWLLTLIVFWLRGSDILDRSMWPDEGATYMRIERDLIGLLSNKIYLNANLVYDTHPPFYFIILKGWALLVGEGEYVLKYLSVLAGVLTVPLSYALAARVFDKRAGVFAALFMTLSGGMQWYSHDLRMYTPIVCFAITSSYSLCRAVMSMRPAIRWWVAWIVISGMAMFTHYTALGLVLGQVLVLMVLVLRRWPQLRAQDKRLIKGVVGTAIVGAGLSLLLPPVWALFVRLSSGSEMNYVFNPLDVIVWSEVNGFLAGISMPDARVWWLDTLTWLVAGVCLVSGLWPLLGRKLAGRMGQTVVLASYAAPMLFWFAISFIKPNYQGFRHLMLVVPFVAVLLAGFLRQLWLRGSLFRMVSGLLLVCVIFAQLDGLAHASWVRIPNWQDDWRGLARYISDNWQSDDLIVIGSPTHIATVKQYVPGFPITSTLPFLRGESLDPQAELAKFVQTHRRVWVTIQDGGLKDFFRQYYRERRSVNFQARSIGIYVILYERSIIFDALPKSATPLNIKSPSSVPGLALAGFEFQPPALFHGQPNMVLSLYWKRGAAGLPSAETLNTIQISTRLLSRDQLWLDWRIPAELQAPPEEWRAERLWRIDYKVLLPIGLPAIPYALQLIGRQGDKSESFIEATQTLSMESVSCCVRVTNWQARSAVMPVVYSPLVSPLSAYRPLVLPALPAQWVGSDIDLINAEFPARVKYGETLNVALTWRPHQAQLSGWDTELRLDSVFNTVAATRRAASVVDAPVEQWSAHEPVRDLYSLAVPPTLNTGWYRLHLERYRDGQRIDQVTLGWVRVEGFDPVTLPAPIANPVAGAVAAFTLQGYAISQPITRSAIVDVHTYWQVQAQPERDGVLFLHVMGPDGELAAQDDNQPELGTRSTLTYRPGEFIDQVHRVGLKADAPPGEYKLYAGVYDRNKDCCRWDAKQNNQRPPDDRIYLGAFTLAPLLAVTRYAENRYMPLMSKE